MLNPPNIMWIHTKPTKSQKVNLNSQNCMIGYDRPFCVMVQVGAFQNHLLVLNEVTSPSILQDGEYFCFNSLPFIIQSWHSVFKNSDRLEHTSRDTPPDIQTKVNGAERLNTELPQANAEKATDQNPSQY